VAKHADVSLNEARNALYQTPGKDWSERAEYALEYLELHAEDSRRAKDSSSSRLFKDEAAARKYADRLLLDGISDVGVAPVDPTDGDGFEVSWIVPEQSLAENLAPVGDESTKSVVKTAYALLKPHGIAPNDPGLQGLADRVEEFAEQGKTAREIAASILREFRSYDELMPV